jgi:hypothetical protein
VFETIVVGVDGRSGGRDALRLAQSAGASGSCAHRRGASRARHGGLSDLVPDAFVQALAARRPHRRRLARVGPAPPDAAREHVHLALAIPFLEGTRVVARR